MTSNDQSGEKAGQAPGKDESGNTRTAQVTHNLDTDEDEPLIPKTEEEESLMDFGSGSGGGSAGDGGAA